MSLRPVEIILDPRERDSPRCGGIFDTDSQSPLAIKLPTFVDAERFVAAVERSGVNIGHYTPQVELLAAYKLWHDAYKRK